MVKDITNKNLVGAETTFQSVMNDKIADELARAKETMSKSLFNDKGQLEYQKKDKKMSVTFTQVRQTIDLYEKVKVDSGEKIVKNEKIGRSKKIEFTITKKGSKFFAYFDGEKYAGTYNNQKKVEDIAKSYLKLVGEELQEVKGKVGSTDGDEEADKNIMMQLRKVISLRGMKPVTFDDNKKAKIDPKVATKILGMYDKLKPAQKLQLQKVLSKSKRDFDKAVQQLKINEYFDEELQEAKEVMSRFRDDRLKKTVMNLAKQKGLKVKELPGGKVEVSGNARKVMDLTLAVQKDDVKIEGFASDAQRRAAFAQGYKAKGKDKKKDEELEERSFKKSAYDIFHKDYSSAIQHATAFAKKIGQEIDPKEIDDKLQQREALRKKNHLSQNKEADDMIVYKAT